MGRLGNELEKSLQEFTERVMFRCWLSFLTLFTLNQLLRYGCHLYFITFIMYLLNMKMKILIAFAAIATVVMLLAYHAPGKCKNNSFHNTYDVIIVLGNPANEDCSPGKMMIERLDKAAELYEEGAAENVIVCGGKAANTCTESTVMFRYLNAKVSTGITILQDSLSKNTYQNAKNAIAIMEQKGWNRALVVTSKFHAKRACGIFSRYNFDYSIATSKSTQNISLIKRFTWKVREALILTYHIFFGYKTNLGLSFKSHEHIKHLKFYNTRYCSGFVLAYDI